MILSEFLNLLLLFREVYLSRRMREGCFSSALLRTHWFTNEGRASFELLLSVFYAPTRTRVKLLLGFRSDVFY